NNSINAVSYQWDFCSGELHETPVVTEINSLSGDLRDIEIVSENNLWYGFVVNKSGKNIIRLDFGNSLENDPTINNLGNIGGLLNKPAPIKLLKENGDWYGLVHNGGSNQLILISFGNSINSNPSTAAFVVNDVGSEFSNLNYGYDKGNLIVALSNYFGSTFTLINFGNSITNSPTVDDIINTTTVSGAGLSDITLINNCGNWYGLGTGFNNKSLYFLNFGTSLFTIPTITNIGDGIFSESPLRIEFTEELNEYIGFVTGIGGTLYRVNLGTDLSNVSLNIDDLGTNGISGQPQSLQLTKMKGQWYGFQATNTGKVYRMDFPLDCGENIKSSILLNPPNLTYSSPGTFNIRLEATDENGISTSQTKQITVANSVAPDISISIDNNQC
ncbi:MAG: PKD domain-containing protein, partial [Balneola sp.]